MRFYLASASPARLALLRAAGIEPVVLPSRVDEPAVVADAERVGGRLDAATMVQLLARAKAEAVVDAQPEAIDGLVFGGDSAFELDGVIYGKPHTADVARERWLIQRGRTGRLYSGHWLIDRRHGSASADGSAAAGGSAAGGSADRAAGKAGTFPALGAVSVASVTFADDITDDEIDAYIATGEPLVVAGAFTIDSLGGPFVTGIEGDPSTVVGLSLPTLRRLVRELGVSWPSLWSVSL